MADKPAVIMTVAGSDSGGGAGIQADLKTFTVLGCFGISAITALTAQNGEGVRGIHAPDPDFVTLQLQTLRDGFPVAAAKTGMLFSAPIIKAVAEALRRRNFPLVVDPVAVSQSGHALLRDDAFAALRERMLPLADLLTPNRPEAEALTGHSLRTAADVAVAGKRLIAMGAKAVLIKGGHFTAEEARDHDGMTDWLCLPQADPLPLRHPRIGTANNHGTGCTLSAAIAAFLGQGQTLRDAVASAQRYLTAALAAAYAPGLGAGPPNFPAGAEAMRRAG